MGLWWHQNVVIRHYAGAILQLSIGTCTCTALRAMRVHGSGCTVATALQDVAGVCQNSSSHEDHPGVFKTLMELSQSWKGSDFRFRGTLWAVVHRLDSESIGYRHPCTAEGLQA